MWFEESGLQSSRLSLGLLSVVSVTPRSTAVRKYLQYGEMFRERGRPPSRNFYYGVLL